VKGAKARTEQNKDVYRTIKFKKPTPEKPTRKKVIIGAAAD
jgi:hypothetical protein